MLRSLRFWAGLAISAVFIWLFFRTTHPGELKDALRDANYWWLAPALAVLFVSISLRCVRWSVLLRPTAPLSPVRLFPYAIIGYMANNLLPARAGELVRAYILGDREHITKTGSLGSIAVERLFDGCVLVLMLLIAGSVVGLDNGRLRAIAIVSSALFLAAIVAFYLLTLREERARTVVRFGLRILPRRWEHRAEEIGDSLVTSLRSVHDWRTLSIVLVLSGMAWTVEAAAYAVIGIGFNLDLGFGEYCLLLAASNLAIIVPTFLGGTGPFEWATKLVLVGAGIPDGVAGAYAIVAHQLVIVPTTILGLIMLWSWGIGFGRITQIEPDDELVAAP
ncbi:MAG: lysylphosphatidylglycerol synthase transmembrane domain-containing protein [Dehalococcoidia bacterium]